MGRVKQGAADQGGGYSDVDVTVVEAYATQKYEYKKKDGSKTGNTSAGVVITWELEDGKQFSDVYSYGNNLVPAASAEDAENGVEAAEGPFLTSREGKSPVLNKSTKWGGFMAKLEAAGFDMEEYAENELDSLVGKRFHIVNFNPGGTFKNPETGKEEPRKAYRVVRAILDGAGQQVKATASAKVGNGKPADTLEQDLQEVAHAVLVEAKKPLFKASLLRQVNAVIEGQEEWPVERAQKAGQLILSDAWLKAPGRPWKYDGKTVVAQ